MSAVEERAILFRLYIINDGKRANSSFIYIVDGTKAMQQTL